MIRPFSLRAGLTSGFAVLAAAGGIWALALIDGARAAPTTYPRPTQITVYELPGYKGRSLVFEKSVPSLAAINFNDRIGSVRIKGPRHWVLCEHRNFMGRCARIRGSASSLKRYKLEGQVSSLYPVADPAPKPKAPR